MGPRTDPPGISPKPCANAGSLRTPPGCPGTGPQPLIKSLRDIPLTARTKVCTSFVKMDFNFNPRPCREEFAS